MRCIGGEKTLRPTGRSPATSLLGFGEMLQIFGTKVSLFFCGISRVIIQLYLIICCCCFFVVFYLFLLTCAIYEHVILTTLPCCHCILLLVLHVRFPGVCTFIYRFIFFFNSLLICIYSYLAICTVVSNFLSM